MFIKLTCSYNQLENAIQTSQKKKIAPADSSKYNVLYLHTNLIVILYISLLFPLKLYCQMPPLFRCTICATNFSSAADYGRHRSVYHQNSNESSVFNQNVILLVPESPSDFENNYTDIIPHYLSEYVLNFFALIMMALLSCLTKMQPLILRSLKYVIQQK